MPILATKLYIPPARERLVVRPRLIKRLNDGLHRKKLTLISAPAGFGKTTLLSEWVASPLPLGEGLGVRAAWLSLDQGDNDPARFLTYLISALQTVAPNIGAGLLGVLQAPQPPPHESLLTSLLNEITTIAADFVLVLDDYHVIDSKPIDKGLTFLIEHLPPQMHLVIATREDPDLPLPRLRASDQLTELRATDLRFTASEAAEFLNQVMGLSLSAEDIAALEARTEGWIAGLQLAAISMQGQKDTTSFIKSFTGSHHFVMDYLVEEVLQRQPENIQTFLLRTSILNRLCGPLCDAVLLDPSAPGQETLEYLEQANLFLIPLDNERHWYRYHHLFADLLRQRLHQSIDTPAEAAKNLPLARELHIRASQWYEGHDLPMEAFYHAAAANDIERAERLIDGKGIPLHLSGGVTPILEWLESLPTEVLNARPSLWRRHAGLLLINGQTAGVGEKLQAAEAALGAILQGAEPDEETRNLIGQIASARATLALTRYDVDTMLAQSRRALEYLHPDSLFTRSTALWVMGFAQILMGDRVAARRALTEAISLSKTSGAMFTMILATIGLGNVQERDNELHLAAETYERVLQWAGDHPQQIIHEAHLGLARILYEWNDLDAAEQHGEQSLILARQYEQVIDRFILCEVFLARLKLARGDVDGAAAMLAKTDQSVREHNFVYRMPEVAAAQVLTSLSQGNLTEAAHLAQTHSLPLSQARVYLAQGDPAAALAVLEPWREQVDAQDWKDERLKVMVLQALALDAYDEKDEALRLLNDALILAEPGGFIRIFVDEGDQMAELLIRLKAEGGGMKEYIHKLLTAFANPGQTLPSAFPRSPQPLIEPLSQRELEVLRLIAEGLSNDEISKRLFLALDTIKGHNRKIFDKLQVQRRTEAVARARELGLL
jgi:LuxR family transcriptional regulator, maltose regulon positive regulatory protein